MMYINTDVFMYVYTYVLYIHMQCCQSFAKKGAAESYSCTNLTTSYGDPRIKKLSFPMAGQSWVYTYYILSYYLIIHYLVYIYIYIYIYIMSWDTAFHLFVCVYVYLPIRTHGPFCC